MAKYSIAWDQKGGVWVPTAMELRGISLPQASKASGSLKVPTVSVNDFSFQVRLDWMSVNEDLSESVFDYQNYGLPAGTPVFEVRDGASKLVDGIRLQKAAVPSARRFVLLSSVITIIALLVIAAFAFFRQRYIQTRSNAQT
ncbi:MAG: hypothetical protein R3C05_05625 [Pirellulaceae bacterium]